MSAPRLGEPGSSLYTWGMRGWLLAGIALGVVVMVSIVTRVSGLAVPLVIAGVLGALFAPAVDRLDAIEGWLVSGDAMVGEGSLREQAFRGGRGCDERRVGVSSRTAVRDGVGRLGHRSVPRARRRRS